MSSFFINRPIVAVVIAIVTVIGGLIAMRGLPLAQSRRAYTGRGKRCGRCWNRTCASRPDPFPPEPG